MNHLIIILVTLLVLSYPGGFLQASDQDTGHVTSIPRLVDSSPEMSPSIGGMGVAKTSRDTVLLVGPWGSGAPVNGQFQDQHGFPAWNGWTHADRTLATQMHWQVSGYQAEALGAIQEPGNLAAWCGDLDYPACDMGDEEGGYGNLWDEELRWTQTVPDSSQPVTVVFTAYINIDTEPAYDFVYIKYLTPDGDVVLDAFDDVLANEFLQYEFTLQPEDFFGPSEDQVIIQVAFESDQAWSDQDCLFPTAGALQIDDITVSLEQGTWSADSVTDFQDGFGDWTPTIPMEVGDFTQIWSYLEDLDPCATNYSPQVAFVDDGEVVPGVGPTYCLDWCYGPNGYIVNTTGGGATPDKKIHNVVRSPVLSWPEGDFEGLFLQFDRYKHHPLQPDFAGTWMVWSVRSANTIDEVGNPTGNTLEEATWRTDGFYYYGGPGYQRQNLWIGGYLVPGRDVFQVELGIQEEGFGFYTGNNGTPAPYIDNVRLKSYQKTGPVYGTDAWTEAQDNFPAIGEVDLINLGNNSVRFDPAITLIDDDTHTPVAGDVFYLNVKPQRQGAELQGLPQVHFLVRQNPLFDPYRTNSQFGSSPSGVVEVGPVYGSGGELIDWMWQFDLPDSNFLFPGDIIHYYVEATDGGGPDNLEFQSITIPSDTTGFSDFSDVRSYWSSMVMRALPSIHENPNDPEQLLSPPILFWNDRSYGLWNEWITALDNLGFVQGQDYDTYFTKWSSSGLGNGLGTRATPYSLMGYESILYDSGAASGFTISDGSGYDIGNDVEVLDSWLRLGNRNLWLTGNNLVSDLILNAGPASTHFVEDWFKVDLITADLRPLIDNQVAPLVQAMPGNGVFLDDLRWVVYGGCPVILEFDAVEPSSAEGAIQLAEFLNRGEAGVYNYSAATYFQDQVTGSQIITMPYSFCNILTPQGGNKASAPLAARVHVMEQVLGLFGTEGDPLDVTTVPEMPKFTVRNFPNPFNPSTRIEYTIAKPGHLSLKVYNVKGELVKNLIDEVKETSGFVIWDGTDSQDAQVASGVYFYEARVGGEVKVEKMVMIK